MPKKFSVVTGLTCISGLLYQRWKVELNYVVRNNFEKKAISIDKLSVPELKWKEK